MQKSLKDPSNVMRYNLSPEQKSHILEAGLWYLVMLIVGPFVLMYVPGQIMVRGDSAATVQNLLDKEFLFRLSCAADMLGGVAFLMTAHALYKLFKADDENNSKLMFYLAVTAAIAGFVLNVFETSALLVQKPGVLTKMPADYLNDLSMMLLKIDAYGSQLLQLYWGLWLLPFGLLTYRSGFAPRLLGVLLWLNGIAYVILSFSFVLFPVQLPVISKWMMPFLFVGELPVIFWLLYAGMRRGEKGAAL